MSTIKQTYVQTQWREWIDITSVDPSQHSIHYHSEYELNIPDTASERL